MEHLHPSVSQTRQSDRTFLLGFDGYYIEISRWHGDLNIMFSADTTPREWFWAQGIEKYVASRWRGDQPPPLVFSSLESLDRFLESCHVDIEEAFSSQKVERTLAELQRFKARR